MPTHPNGGGFVAATATVALTAYVGEHAQVLDNAQVLDSARIEGLAEIKGNAIVRGDALVKSKAVISGDAIVEGTARVMGLALVTDNAVVGNGAVIGGNMVATKPVVVIPEDERGMDYPATIADDMAWIGCCVKTLDYWTTMNSGDAENFSNRANPAKQEAFRQYFQPILLQIKQQRELS